MKFSALSRTGFAVALSAVLVSTAAPAMAADQDNNIFSQVTPSLRDRMFFRINYISANVKTTSGDAYDVDPLIVTTSDLRNMGQGGSYTYSRASSTRVKYYRTNNNNSSTAYGVLRDALADDLAEGYSCETLRDGLGTPCGVRARANTTVGTASLSVGYYFSDDRDWAIEAQVLASPLGVDIYGDGPTVVNGEKLIKLKMLPPTAVLGRYFGDKKNTIRPFLGYGVSYAFFFDVKATDYLNSFVGGSSAGDTTIKVRNTLGHGPFVGLKADVSDDWHVSVNVGKLQYKTDATITTNNTVINENSKVLAAYGPHVANAISASSGILEGSSGSGDGITKLMCDLAEAKYGNTNCNLGTFVRKQSTKLDATMFMIAVGRSF